MLEQFFVNIFDISCTRYTKNMENNVTPLFYYSPSSCRSKPATSGTYSNSGSWVTSVSPSSLGEMWDPIQHRMPFLPLQEHSNSHPHSPRRDHEGTVIHLTGTALNVEGNRSPRRKPTQTRRERANSTQTRASAGNRFYFFINIMTK